MYKGQQEGGNAQQGPENNGTAEGGSANDVTDVEYEEVK